MKGHILGPDASGQTTVVSGEDGRRYRFADFEWRHTIPPSQGEEVDFEPDGARARDVYRLAPAPDIGRAAETPLQMLLRQPAVRFLLARPVLTTALLVLLACFTAAYALDGARLSLYAAVDLAWRMSLAVDGLLAGSGPDPGPRLAGATARIASALLLLLYAVPALAAVVAWRELVGRPDPRLARLAGLMAMVLPVALPALVIAIVRLGVLPGLEVPLRLGRDGVTAPAAAFHPVQLFAGGTLVIMAAGFALWAAARGRLTAWIAAAAQPQRHAGSAAPAGDDAAAFDYVPPWPRAPASGQREPADPPPAAGIPAAQAAPEPSGYAPEQSGDAMAPDAMATLTRQLRMAISGKPDDPQDERGAAVPRHGAVSGPAAGKMREAPLRSAPTSPDRPGRGEEPYRRSRGGEPHEY